MHLFSSYFLLLLTLPARFAILPISDKTYQTPLALLVRLVRSHSLTETMQYTGSKIGNMIKKEINHSGSGKKEIFHQKFFNLTYLNKYKPSKIAYQ